MKYRVREVRYVGSDWATADKVFIPEIKRWWCPFWRQWYRLRWYDDSCPPVIKFPTLQGADAFLKDKIKKNYTVSIIHPFDV